MIRRINESQTLTKHISCACKGKFDGRKCNFNRKWNKDICRCECKNLRKHHLCGINCIWNATTSTCENGKYSESIIIGNSVITRNESIKATNTIRTKSIPIKNFYILLTLLISTITLLTVVSVYCCFIKH